MVFISSLQASTCIYGILFPVPGIDLHNLAVFSPIIFEHVQMSFKILYTTSSRILLNLGNEVCQVCLYFVVNNRTLLTRLRLKT